MRVPDKEAIDSFLVRFFVFERKSDNGLIKRANRANLF